MYMLKNLVHTILRKVKCLVAAAAKYNKLIQMGSQRRSFPKVMEGIQALKEGVIGRVYFAKGWYANGRKPIGIGKVATPPSTWIMNYGKDLHHENLTKIISFITTGIGSGIGEQAKHLITVHMKLM